MYQQIAACFLLWAMSISSRGYPSKVVRVVFMFTPCWRYAWSAIAQWRLETSVDTQGSTHRAKDTAEC